MNLSGPESGEISAREAEDPTARLEFAVRGLDGKAKREAVRTYLEDLSRRDPAAAENAYSESVSIGIIREQDRAAIDNRMKLKWGWPTISRVAKNCRPVVAAEGDGDQSCLHMGVFRKSMRDGFRIENREPARLWQKVRRGTGEQ